MAITIDGTGTITGISAGGLPDGCIKAADLDGAQSGSAPIFGARAWVKFNGTGTVAINGSGNVSSITDSSTGSYLVNFTTAMPDTNYCATTAIPQFSPYPIAQAYLSAFNTGSVGISVAQPGTADYDCANICVTVFR